MNISKVFFLLLTSLVLLLAQGAYTQDVAVTRALREDTSQENQAQALESLVSTNGDMRLQAAVKLDEQRRQLVQKLMAILDSTNSLIMKLDAVVVLGEYRASEAAPVLARHLEWDEIAATNNPFTKPIMTEEDWAEKSPVIFALQKIGMPAIPALLDKITQTDDAKITFECVTICNAIEGAEETQFRLQGLLNKENDQKKKERIQAALDALKKLNPAK
jgi:hypothetical protein